MALRSLILATSIALAGASIAAAPATGAPAEAATAAATSLARTATPLATAGQHRVNDSDRAAKATTEKRSGYTKRLARAMNKVREKHDLKPVRMTGCLNKVAKKWARHLAKTGKFEHQDLYPILERCDLRRVGEILAKGSVTPKQMIRMWLDSPGHRKLLLDPGFRKAGVAAKRDANGSWVGCIDFGRG